MTLYTCLVTLSKLSAPFTPFMTEQIYQNLVVNLDPHAKESIHLTDYPVSDGSYINKALEQQMEELLKIIVIGRSLRNTSNMKNRQPLRKIFISSEKKLDNEYIDLLLDELNIKEAVYIKDASMFIDYELKPQLRTLGKKYGKFVPLIGEHLKSCDGQAVMDIFLKGDSYTFMIDDKEIVLDKDDVQSFSKQKGGFVSMTDNGITVVLDTNLDDELIKEGYIRELVSKIQTMRKDAGFNVTDKILVCIENSKYLEDLLADNFALMKHDIMANAISNSIDATFYKASWDINGIQCDLFVKQDKGGEK
jgi:isoleucyl-tRNA synthetase